MKKRLIVFAAAMCTSAFEIPCCESSRAIAIRVKR